MGSRRGQRPSLLLVVAGGGSRGVVCCFMPVLRSEICGILVQHIRRCGETYGLPRTDKKIK